jgi:hypothetical protein
MTIRTSVMGVTLIAPAGGCGGLAGATRTAEQTSQIAKRVDALVVDARAAAVTIETGRRAGHRHRDLSQDFASPHKIEVRTSVGA